MNEQKTESLGQLLRMLFIVPYLVCGIVNGVGNTIYHSFYTENHIAAIFYLLVLWFHAWLATLLPETKKRNNHGQV